MKKLISIFLLIVIYSTNLFAFEKQAENFVLETANNAKKIIINAKINDKEKKRSLEQLALNTVDVAGLAKFTLGDASKNLSEKQILEFVETFKVFFSKNISNKLKDYSDQNVIIIGSKKISENYVLVNSKITSNKDKQEIIVDWRVFLVNNKLIIRDLVVEGLSLARTQREEFASIIANKGFDTLIMNLKDYISKN
jgi:phospholipid transport system substrate-binding protein